MRRDFSQATFHVGASGGNRSNKAHGDVLAGKASTGASINPRPMVLLRRA
jgi:hypothetical protein